MTFFILAATLLLFVFVVVAVRWAIIHYQTLHLAVFCLIRPIDGRLCGALYDKSPAFEHFAFRKVIKFSHFETNNRPN